MTCFKVGPRSTLSKTTRVVIALPAMHERAKTCRHDAKRLESAAGDLAKCVVVTSKLALVTSCRRFPADEIVAK